MSSIDEPAGFIIFQSCFDQTVVWAFGKTEAEAWSYFRDEVEPYHPLEKEVVASFRVAPATPTLIAEIDEHGGHVPFEQVMGVACTPAEYRAAR